MDVDKFGNGSNFPIDEKREILRFEMTQLQPSLRRDFEGDNNFPDTRKDERWLNKKYDWIRNSDKVNVDDEAAHDLEPLLAYLLNDKNNLLLPSRDSFAFLASDYDDKANGTDIAFFVKNKEKVDYIALSIDAGSCTSQNRMFNKFRNMMRYGGVANIKYCKYEDRKWSEEAAPHFILGMSPASEFEAFKYISVANGLLEGHDYDARTSFIILSELREQIIMHKNLSKNTDTTLSSKMDDIFYAINSGIAKIIPKNAENNGFDINAYQNMVETIMRADDVYKNIINISSTFRSIKNLGAQANSIVAS